MLEKMEKVSIDWGYHTMVKKLDFLGGDFFIGKFVRKDDRFVSWHMHEKSGKGVTTEITMVVYDADEDNEEREKEALSKIIKSFEKVTGVTFSEVL